MKYSFYTFTLKMIMNIEENLRKIVFLPRYFMYQLKFYYKKFVFCQSFKNESALIVLKIHYKRKKYAFICVHKLNQFNSILCVK